MGMVVIARKHYSCDVSPAAPSATRQEIQFEIHYLLINIPFPQSTFENLNSMSHIFWMVICDNIIPSKI